MDPQRPNIQQRKSHRFSFRSDKSHKRKESLVESATEKKKTHMSQHTKANPNAAINEVQPAAAALEKPTIAGLSNMQYTDLNGNIISDPDRSNPTRWRMERPLETIKAFEAAIDKAHSSRASVYAPPTGPQSRRSSSYWGGNNGNHNGQGYDYNRPPPSSGYPSQYYGNGQDGYNEYNYGPPPANRSEAALSRHGGPQNVYPAVGGSRSKDTLNTGASSGSEQYGQQSTAPTSEDSQGFARPGPNQQHPGYQNGYGQYDEGGYGAQQGYGQRPGPNYNGGYQQQQYGQGQGQGQNQGQNQGQGPPPPNKDPRPPAAPKNVIRLSQSSVSGTEQAQAADGQQRDSWFKKRFSRGK